MVPLKGIDPAENCKTPGDVYLKGHDESPLQGKTTEGSNNLNDAH